MQIRFDVKSYQVDSTLIDLQILDKVVKDASLYTAMETPGSLQSSHLFPPFSGDLVLLALPDAVSCYFHSNDITNFHYLFKITYLN